MFKEKLVTILRFLFVILPFFIVGGLELVILHNRDIVCYSYEVKTLTKKRKKIDKDKFAKMMNRITK